MRTLEKSSLDFAYWMNASVDKIYDGNTYMPFVSTNDESLMRNIVISCASTSGVTMSRKMAVILSDVEAAGTAITPAEAFRTRGAILYRKGIMTMSQGDSKRLIAVDDTSAVSLYFSGDDERLPSHWDGAFKIPGMRYL